MFECEILKIIDETSDVKTFRLSRPKGFVFTPGQFCKVGIDEDECKPFTMSSSPLSEDYIDFTIKLMTNVTKKLFSLNVGDKVCVSEPRSTKMDFDDTVTDNVVFIAGGSGITPFITAMRYAVEKNLSNKMILFFGNRTQADIIYKEELLELGSKDNIDVVNVLSEEEWDGETGHINSDIIKKYVDVSKKYIWYLCGPPGMVDTITEQLIEIGIPESDLRFDTWKMPSKTDLEK